MWILSIIEAAVELGMKENQKAGLFSPDCGLCSSIKLTRIGYGCTCL